MMYNRKRPIAANSSLIPDQFFPGSLTRMDPVMPVPNQAWRSFPANRNKDTLEENLKIFWARQRNDIENSTGPQVRSHRLSLARIKKVMKSDPNVKMVSADSPVILAKACEIFIMELALRAWIHTQSSSHQTIRACDVAEAIRNSELHDYLVDLVPLKLPSVNHQAVPERALNHQLFHLANVNELSTKPTIDMEQIQQDNLMADGFINTEEFELNPNLQ